jgi:hypothetical protein
MAGTTFSFPRLRAWPALLVERAEADLAIGGESAAAGAYFARVTGATTEPAAYGRPLLFSAGRGSEAGPRDVRVGGMLDRTGEVPRDSLSAFLDGVSLPAVPIPQARAELDLGAGAIEIALARTGPDLSGVYRITSDAVRWERAADTSSGGSAPLGSREWAEGLLWRSLSTVRNVTIEVRVSGRLSAPRLSVSSNVGDAVSSSLRQALGEEIRRAENRARSEVDRLVGEQVLGARAQLSRLENQVAQRLAEQDRQLGELRLDIEQQLQRIASGVRLPGGIRLPRP